MPVGLAETFRRETGIRFVTRRRYIRAVVSGGAIGQASLTLDYAARSSPEMGLD